MVSANTKALTIGLWHKTAQLLTSSKPFLGPNTTLPHPEADLSPNCTLSHDEVSVERALLKRHRLSFLRRNKRGVTSGTLDPQEDAFRNILSLTMMDIDGHGSGSSNFINPSASSLRLSKDGNDSLRSTSKRDDNDNDTPPTSPDGSEHHHKSGIFGKWRRT